uniref:NAD-dependent epimerase/dehydratase domain-containing protein n=1 Tax=Amphimedon queenslandica TaxID=400682 RepID=A0A1X7V130_AMPQE
MSLEEPTSSPPQVLVTGASGYVASHLVQHLLVGGKVKVRGTVRSLKNESKSAPLMKLVPDAKYPLELVEADLLNEESWIEAVKGCDYVYHVASPIIRLGATVSDEQNEIIKPAVDGTLNVLKACVAAGTIKRVVITSSIAAISGGLLITKDTPYTEEDWVDDSLIHGYEKSKVLAERAAWDFVEKLDKDKKFELAVVNPSIIWGPPLTKASAETPSVDALKKVLTKELPALIHVSIAMIDVRDLAAIHVAAMETPEAAGQRYIANADHIWYKEAADMIAEEFGPQGYKTTTYVMPKFLVAIFKVFNSILRQAYPAIGTEIKYDNTKMISQLGIQLRDSKTTIMDTCYGLIEIGAVEKKERYRGPPKAESMHLDLKQTVQN